MPHSAQPQHTNYWAPRTRKLHQQKAATRRNMRRAEQVTVQGSVKEQQPDGISHRGQPSFIRIKLPGGGSGWVLRGVDKANLMFFKPQSWSRIFLGGGWVLPQVTTPLINEGCGAGGGRGGGAGVHRLSS